eukprot:TRINITY_DN109068_c0_g1_i1.p1 TRINITY_DN109068_c0_g1~~TRINITY_DN109068_c0_g1_i1.p1  ORF type:complete len:402 (-),score=46.51 TRINITY_DN109068_c0_g1_i1:79-1173(-)
MFDWFSTLCLLVYVYISAFVDENLDANIEHPAFMAILVLGRWLQLTWTCRAFKWAGQKILPILNATFGRMSGIFLVTLFILAGFVSAFLALELGSENPVNYSVLLGAVRLLLLGDGDGIDVVLQLGGAPQEGTWFTFVFLCFAVVTFCVAILNLFIAVRGEAYDNAQEKAHTSWLQERAAICLQCSLRPSWPPSFLSSCRFPNRAVVYVAGLLVILPIWVNLLRVPQLDPSVPSFLLLLWMVLGDSILVQRPWDKDKQDQYYLWVCYRADYDESKYWPSEADGDSIDMHGRFAGIKRDAQRKFQKMTSDIDEVRNYVADTSEGLEKDMQAVDRRLDGLESTVQKLISSISRLHEVSHPVQPILE